MGAASHLFLNHEGRLYEATDRATGLAHTGMVTSALWSDANYDGWIDLFVTHEWGPVKYFRNEQGHLVDATAEAGLDQWLGWWNSIASRDFDGDGDIDYAVGNFGLNTKYHATRERPALIYYGDFERNSRMQIVEAEYEGEKLFPIRGRSCSSNAMPTLKGKFQSYREFASAELDRIYDDDCLNAAKRFEANTLETGVLWNDGSGRFTFRPLPRLAQIAPVFGIVSGELDGDGIADLFLAQNFFSPQPETGRMDGGLGLLLLGRANGEFTACSPAVSGIVVPDDARSASLADLNHDAAPDLVVTTNDGPVRSFVNQATDQNRFVRVVLVGLPGNPRAVGARVTVKLSDGSRQTAEVTAGAGYLTQDSTALVFGRTERTDLESVRIVWPNGEERTVSATDAEQTIVISETD
jgi:hypothetical protein